MPKDIKVAISADFLTAFARLPRGVQGKVTDFVNKLRKNPLASGINYEKIRQGADKKMCSARIDDTYRCIVVRQPESGVFLLLWVDHHDEAYEWAVRKKCDVNPNTGAIQVYEVQTVKETAADYNIKPSVFGSLKDKDLLSLGVPQVQLDFVKAITDKEELYAAEGSLPGDAFEYLSLIAEGIEAEEVIQMAKEEAASSNPAEDFASAFNAPATLKSFVVVDGEEELMRIMAEPLEKWRVFLHPTQQKIVNSRYSGSARVLGGAGTGKTVVAMHRAKHLASGLEDGKKILVTTFTANLAADIKDNLKKICSAEELKKIDVIHLDAWVGQFMKNNDPDVRIGYDEDIKSLWEKALKEAGTDLNFNEKFYEEEWNRVVIAGGGLTLEEYLKAKRTGRVRGLNKRQRTLVWRVFESYRSLMNENKIRDINTAMYETSQRLKEENSCPVYEHIIVDEGQDFSDNSYKLLRTLAGDSRPDDIFIVGDSHQRIYRNHPTLSKCGINVRGRSSILKINYRTTEEIRAHAFAMLDGISFDDLDGGFDPGDKCRSLTHGEKPIIKAFDDEKEEADFIIGEINRLKESGIELNDICLTARTKKLVDEYISRISKAGIRSFAIKRNKTDDRAFDGLRAATMHRVKGLEFKYVFIAAVNDKIIPHSSAIDRTSPLSEAESLTAEKCLLYVAMTRAQKGVYITSSGKKSEFLK
ncbi:MAG: AAA family ATPase [Clostridiales bacterium]|nr:AAA family ATPase [Clostridiales bacterium]